MTNEIKNVPELRFPGFNGEWELLNLSKVLKDKSDGIKRGPFGGALKKEIFVSDGYAVYEQQNAIYDTQKFRYFITEQKFQEMKGFSIKENDIIMSCSGTIGKLSLIPSVYKKGIINQALIRFRTNNNILADYFLIYMRSNYMQRKILESNPGSAIVNLIPVKELKNLPFPLPNIKEQQKISAFFSKLDRQIELEEQKLEKLEEQKKGYMQKIFSQQLRFKDENGNDYPEWKLCKLKDITISLKGQEKITKNLPILTISASKGWLKQEERFSQIIAGNSLKKYTHIKKGDLSYNKGNSKLAKYGIVYMLKEGEALVPNVYKSFRPKKYIASYFLEKYFHSQSVDRQLRTKISSTARMDGLLNISDKDFYEVNLKIPSYSEQDKIGSFFKKFDGFIGKQLNKVELLKERKKGFLQKMFV